MSRISAFAVATALLAFTACFSSTEPVLGDSSLTVANATLGTLEIFIDGRPITFGGLSMNGLSNAFALPAGMHQVRLTEGGASAATVVTIETRRDIPLTLVAYPSRSAGTTGPATTVLVDTGSYVPSGKSRLRVANLTADAGAIEIWRSQPDAMSGGRITTPFPCPPASPYLQSDPGVWEVWTTAPGSATRTASSGPIEIPDGARRTVLLLDSPDGPRFVVVAD